MTWQGGKLRRDAGPPVRFAPLKALAGQQDDAEKSFGGLAHALSGFGKALKVHIRMVTGAEGETVQHWEIQGGTKTGKVRKGETKDADVVVVMRPETWAQIAQGQLAPYEAMYRGKLRVGGDFELAKRIVKYLTEPAAQYVSPC